MTPTPLKVRKQRLRLAVTAILAAAMGVSIAAIWFVSLLAGWVER